MALGNRGPLGLKEEQPQRTEASLEYMGLVRRQLACVVCGARPCHAHHVQCGRFSQIKASDWHVIPLCPECHQDGPQAFHRGKRSWVARNGLDTDYIGQTRAQILRLIERGLAACPEKMAAKIREKLLSLSR